MTKTRDATLKCKDRLDFYPCVTDSVLDTSDHASREVTVEIVLKTFTQNLLDAW